MKSREINSLFNNLSKVIKNPKSDLKYKNKFTLLVSVVLSAQCTDTNVNNVTKNIYPKYIKPEHFVKLGRKKIEKLIKSIGLFRNKAKSIYLLSGQLIEKHNGKVPNKFDNSFLNSTSPTSVIVLLVRLFPDKKLSSTSQITSIIALPIPNTFIQVPCSVFTIFNYHARLT